MTEPKWLTDLRDELMRSPMKSGFTMTRDELMYMLGMFDGRRAFESEGARSVSIDLAVFDVKGDPRSNLIKRGWIPPDYNAPIKHQDPQQYIRDWTPDFVKQYVASLHAQIQEYVETRERAFEANSKQLIEKAAEKIYDAFDYDGFGSKPKWVPNGNSLKQCKARAFAVAAFSAL